MLEKNKNDSSFSWEYSSQTDTVSNYDIADEGVMSRFSTIEVKAPEYSSQPSYDSSMTLDPSSSTNGQFSSMRSSSVNSLSNELDFVIPTTKEPKNRNNVMAGKNVSYLSHNVKSPKASIASNGSFHKFSEKITFSSQRRSDHDNTAKLRKGARNIRWRAFLGISYTQSRTLPILQYIALCFVLSYFLVFSNNFLFLVSSIKNPTQFLQIRPSTVSACLAIFPNCTSICMLTHHALSHRSYWSLLGSLCFIIFQFICEALIVIALLTRYHAFVAVSAQLSSIIISMFILAILGCLIPFAFILLMNDLEINCAPDGTLLDTIIREKIS